MGESWQFYLCRRHVYIVGRFLSKGGGRGLQRLYQAAELLFEPRCAVVVGFKAATA